MNTSGNSNIYEFEAARTLKLYAPFISGTGNNTVVVIGENAISPNIQKAISDSAERLGYGKNACSWVSVKSQNDERTLEANDLRMIIEGINPLSIIALNKTSAELLGQAFGLQIPLDTHTRILGRDIAALKDFALALEDQTYKRIAWKALLGLELD